MLFVKSEKPAALAMITVGLAIILLGEATCAIISNMLLLQVSCVAMIWAFLNAIFKFALTVFTKRISQHLSFGYNRLSAVGMLFAIFLSWTLSSFVLAEYIDRFASPQDSSLPAYTTIAIVASCDFAAKLLVLRRKADYILTFAMYIGFMVAPLSDVAELVVVPCIIIMILILSALPVRECLRELMMATPPNVDMQTLYESLSEIENVHEVHDLHVWRVGRGNLRFTCHMLASEHNDVLLKVEKLLRERYDISHTTVQLESLDQNGHKCVSCSTATSFLAIS